MCGGVQQLVRLWSSKSIKYKIKSWNIKSCYRKNNICSMWKNISLPCEEHQKSALFKRLPEPAAEASWGVIAAHRVLQPQRSPSCQFPIWPPWILVHFRKQMTYTMTNTNTEYTKADHFLEAAKKAWESRRTGRGPFLITHPTSVQTLLLPQHS